MIKLFLVDDHPLVAGGVAAMIKDEDSLQLMGSAGSGAEALAFLATHTPDIILLDISLPDTDGLKLCDEIRSLNMPAKIIALTSANDASIITQFLYRGGNGYLLKNMDRTELLHAIDTVLANKIYLSASANDKVLQQFASVRAALNEVPRLTRREKEILDLLYEGANGPAIAEKLFLSPYTVETHRKNLMQKFSVSSTQQLIRVAMEKKLIQV